MASGLSLDDFSLFSDSGFASSADNSCEAFIEELLSPAINPNIIEAESPNQQLNLTPPDTPQSSDRSTPPSVCEYSPCSPASTVSYDLNLLSPPMSVNSVPSPPGCVVNQPIILPPHPVNQAVVQNVLPVVIAPRNNEAQLMHFSQPSYPQQQATVPMVTPATRQQRHNSSSSTDEDKKRAMKEARKIRNRESARNSHMKQKEHVKALEDKCSALEKENSALKQENASLRTRVQVLERDILQIKSTADLSLSSSSGKRKAISLMAIIFTIGLNLAPFSNLVTLNSTNRPIAINKLESHSGRTLLWTNVDDSSQLKSDVKLIKRDIISSQVDYDVVNNTLTPDCQQAYINKTETMRLENDLRGWALRVELEKNEKKKRAHAKRQKKLELEKQRKLRKPIPLSLRMKNFIEGSNSKQLDLFDNLGTRDKFDFNYKHLLEVINRRDDTFYFVSFSAQDHILLPPGTNKTNFRPRFSVLMPSLAKYNETHQETGVNTTYSILTMMQIDCEVMNTRLVEIKNLIEDGSKKPSKNATAETSQKRTNSTKRRTSKSTVKQSNIESKNATSASNSTNSTP